MADEEINTTVSFRLSPALHAELLQLADASGINRHKMARTLVVQALRSKEADSPEVDPAGLEDAFQSIQTSVKDLRMVMGRGVGAILQEVAPNRDKEEIRKWIFDRMITPSTEAPPEEPEGD